MTPGLPGPCLLDLGFAFPHWHRQDAALNTTPGEHPRIMIDAPRICQDLSCSKLGFACPVPRLRLGLAPLSAANHHLKRTSTTY